MLADRGLCATCGGAIAPGDAFTVEVGGETVSGAALSGELEHRARDRAARLRHHRCDRDRRPLPAVPAEPAPDLAMRWRFAEETIEDVANRSLHRPGCSELARSRDVVHYGAGSVAVRTALPNQCATCRPEVTIVLGRVDG